MPLESGAKVGNYVLERSLDRGNMGELWVARRGKLTAAVKFMLNAQPHLVERFKREIEILSELKSPYVVSIKDWGEFEGSPYMVMDLLHGSNLASLLQAGGPIRPVTTAVDYIVQAAAGLVEAHGKRIIHRDLKPANLFLDTDAGHLKVLDFGVAGAAPAASQALTQDGVYIGTPNYSAPEQFVNTSTVTAAADIWALGAVLYELLTARMAFPGGGEGVLSVLAAVSQQEPAAMSGQRKDVPEGLADCIARCLRKDPAQRFASAMDLIDALAPWGSEASHAIRSTLRVRLSGQFAAADTHVAPLQRPEVAPAPEAPGSLAPTSNTNPPVSLTFALQSDLVNAVMAPQIPPNSNVRRPIVFMLGAGFSLPSGKHKGVPGTEAIIERIRKVLGAHERPIFEQALDSSENRYQDAFDYLNSVRGQDAANQVIRLAVLDAYRPRVSLPIGASEQETACAGYEEATDDWDMPPGVSQLGRIIAAGLRDKTLRHFSGRHLTTNFDPLLSVAIARHGGVPVEHAIARDFEVPPPSPKHCQIIHLHGRWNRGDTLHNRLDEERALLEGSLEKLLHESVLVVLGYGGWNDVFMQVLRDVAKKQTARLNILWAFYDDQATVMKRQRAFVEDLAARCGQRIQFYQRVDTNEFFRTLAATALGESDPPKDGDDARDWRKTAVVLLSVCVCLGLFAWFPFRDQLRKPAEQAQTTGQNDGGSGEGIAAKAGDAAVAQGGTQSELNETEQGGKGGGAVTSDAGKGTGGRRVGPGKPPATGKGGAPPSDSNGGTVGVAAVSKDTGACKGVCAKAAVAAKDACSGGPAHIEACERRAREALRACDSSCEKP